MHDWRGATIFPLLCLVLLLLSYPVAATSGPGCFRVRNVASNDVLNVRAEPSASARVVTTLLPENDPGIIASTGECEPPDAALESRWCPVKIYSGDKIMQGWAKRAYLLLSECP